MRHHVEHAVEYKEVPYDSAAIDSYSTFGRAYDLFGDGSVRLVAHARAHRTGTSR